MISSHGDRTSRQVKTKGILVDFSVTSSLCHLPGQPIIRLQTRLRNLQAMLLHQLNISDVNGRGFGKKGN